ncbi:DUF1064 domain-containing protein [Treponema phagedenis]|uniref:DUF1064 domain-containing protein n=1 Tax=Treponema phagedenis TaxID=162 RepID=UPI001C0689D2|nr:DUF1064 domain-containing protein [Treponema phagedenis]
MSYSHWHKYKTAPKEQRTADGIVFASKAEMLRYKELRLLEKSGVIKNLELQPKFLIIPATEKGGRATHYVADFRYTTKGGGEIVEDVKGVKTEVYKLKKKLLLWQYPEINFYENKV